jgi:hypothetical protein
MIENEKLGAKIAENKIEALWERSIKATESRMEELRNTLIVEEAFLETCKRKLDEIKKK